MDGQWARRSLESGRQTPARIRELSALPEKRGLDPNIWPNNVEVIAAQKIGAGTVTYVSNIYKYYVA